jgi:DNA-binding transcriptional regulator/RsmH inhibitor MraZ
MPMSACATFSGFKSYTLDSRCRVTVQQSWRPAEGTEWVLLLSQRKKSSPYPYIRVITSEQLAAQRLRIANSQVMSDPQKQAMRRDLAARCWEGYLSEGGKLQLPQPLCKVMDLGPDTEVVQLGRDDFFEIHKAANFNYLDQIQAEQTEVVMPENNDVPYM